MRDYLDNQDISYDEQSNLDSNPNERKKKRKKFSYTKLLTLLLVTGGLVGAGVYGRRALIDWLKTQEKEHEKNIKPTNAGHITGTSVGIGAGLFGGVSAYKLIKKINPQKSSKFIRTIKHPAARATAGLLAGLPLALGGEHIGKQIDASVNAKKAKRELSNEIKFLQKLVGYSFGDSKGSSGSSGSSSSSSNSSNSDNKVNNGNKDTNKSNSSSSSSTLFRRAITGKDVFRGMMDGRIITR